MKATIAASLILAIVVGGANAADASWALCPSDPDVSTACAEAIYPPFPICQKKSAKEWIAHAQDAATRCCGDDTSACKCPQKDSDAFQAKIGGYCAAVLEGGVCKPAQPGAVGNGLLRGFDREQQVQREELAP